MCQRRGVIHIAMTTKGSFPPILRYAIGLLLWYTMTSCSDDSTPGAARISGKLESTAVAASEDVVIYDLEGKSLEVEVESIEDSRCPSDVLCVWVGSARVSFAITGYKDTIDLILGAGVEPKAKSHTFVFDGATYELTLVDVTPYPSTQNQETPKEVHFTLRSH